MGVAGRQLDVGQKILAFGDSLAVVTAIGVAAATSFCATCSLGFSGGEVVGAPAVRTAPVGYIYGHWTSKHRRNLHRIPGNPVALATQGIKTCNCDPTLIWG